MGVRYRAYSASGARIQRLRRRAEHEDDIPPQLAERAAADPSRLGHKDVLSLQRLVGNQAVSQMASAERGRNDAIDGGSQSSFYFDVLVARREGPAPERDKAKDAGKRTPRPDTDAAAPGEEPVQTVEGPGCAEVEESDAVTPELTYQASIGARATPPDASLFGVTTTNVTMSGVNAVPDAKGGAFKITGTANVSAKWSVHSRGRIDVPYATAPVVTSTTYPQVAKDLTPNMSSDGGRPPRKKYWAKDLTERHEKFHADERTDKYGKAAFAFATAWLASQTAATAQDAKNLAAKVPDKMFESYNASFVPGKENRAYGEGAIPYQVRADMAKGYGEQLKKLEAGH